MTRTTYRDVLIFSYLASPVLRHQGIEREAVQLVKSKGVKIRRTK